MILHASRVLSAPTKSDWIEVTLLDTLWQLIKAWSREPRMTAGSNDLIRRDAPGVDLNGFLLNQMDVGPDSLLSGRYHSVQCTHHSIRESLSVRTDTDFDFYCI